MSEPTTTIDEQTTAAMEDARRVELLDLLDGTASLGDESDVELAVGEGEGGERLLYVIDGGEACYVPKGLLEVISLGDEEGVKTTPAEAR